MMIRNFSGGPGALPPSVVEGMKAALTEVPGSKVGIMSLSHRSSIFREILDEAEARIRAILRLSSSVRVLFMQGGGSLQFAMIPLNFQKKEDSATAVITGYWSQKFYEAASKVHFCSRFRLLDKLDSSFVGSKNDQYVHYASNETVEGIQFRAPLSANAPLICDMSSDFLTSPFNMSDFALVYAHAQKNLGPSGVTVVLVRDDALERCERWLPPILSYRAHVEARSLLHTPPTVSIYATLLVLRWMEERFQNDLTRVEAFSREKAACVRSAIHASPFWSTKVPVHLESDMNIAFFSPSSKLDREFVAEAEKRGMIGLEGHRSQGGLRVSLYNGVTLEDAQTVASFIEEFAQRYVRERPNFSG